MENKYFRNLIAMKIGSKISKKENLDYSERFNFLRLNWGYKWLY